MKLQKMLSFSVQLLGGSFVFGWVFVLILSKIDILPSVWQEAYLDNPERYCLYSGLIAFVLMSIFLFVIYRKTKNTNLGEKM